MTIEETSLKTAKTPRRESREKYARYLLNKAGVDGVSAESFLSTKQAVLNNESPLDLIYTGRYERAVSAVEDFVEDLKIEDL